jgi:hypothetical protein
VLSFELGERRTRLDKEQSGPRVALHRRNLGHGARFDFRRIAHFSGHLAMGGSTHPLR